MAQIRRAKIKMSKKIAAMTDEEFEEYSREGIEELEAEGFEVIYSLK